MERIFILLMKKLLFKEPSKQQIDFVSLILRVGFGLLMIPKHGWAKIQKFPELSETFMNFMGLGSKISLGLVIFSEFFCSILLILGLFTRAAVIPLIITIIVIMNKHNWEFFGKQELVTAFMFGYLAIFFLGGGKYSLDHILFKNKRRKY